MKLLSFLILFVSIQAFAGDKYKIKYRASISYSEPDGTRIVLPDAVGKVWMRVSDQACLMRVGGWESNIMHICRIAVGTKGLAPKEVEISDDTFVTMLLESLKFLLDRKYAYALKIFNQSNVYVNDQFQATRVVNQSSAGSFFLNFSQPTRIALEHAQLKHKIRVEIRFEGLRRTIRRNF